jgi:mono/diheme cytochrome c family protein
LHFDRASERYRQDFLSVARAQWQRRWPYGLKVPNPDIRNREPVFAHPDIPAIFDPLNLRPPLETWHADRTRDVEQTVTGLAEFLPAADLKRLDRYLVAGARSDGAALSTLQSPCMVRRLAPRGTLTRLKVRCGPALVLEGTLRFDSGRLLDGALERIELADGTVFPQLVTPEGELRESPAGDVVTLYPEQRRTGFRIRFPDGRSITRLQIRLSEAGDDATATLQVVDDFKKVTAAVDSLMRDTAGDRAGPFAPRPFQGTRAMQALFSSLGLAPTRWCCDDDRPLPLARAETDIAQASVAGLEDVGRSAGLRTFYRYCAGCHRTHNRVPPNFLMGDSASVKSRIRQCAPRILARLSMWSREPDARSVTPMPPLPALAAHGLSEAAWRESGELAALKNYARRIVESESPANSAGAALDRDYAKLRTCVGE